jgi:hypothetical protein
LAGLSGQLPSRRIGRPVSAGLGGDVRGLRDSLLAAAGHRTTGVQPQRPQVRPFSGLSPGRVRLRRRARHPGPPPLLSPARSPPATWLSAPRPARSPAGGNLHAPPTPRPPGQLPAPSPAHVPEPPTACMGHDQAPATPAPPGHQRPAPATPVRRNPRHPKPPRRLPVTGPASIRSPPLTAPACGGPARPRSAHRHRDTS